MMTNPRLYLLGIVLTAILGFVFRKVWKNRRMTIHRGGSRSVFASVKGRVTEILLGDQAKRAHREERTSFRRVLGRILFFKWFRLTRNTVRVNEAYGAAEVRRLNSDSYVAPPRFLETTRRVVYEFFRNCLRTMRETWRAIRSFIVTRWQERRPIREARAERRAERIRERAEAIRNTDEREPRNFGLTRATRIILTVALGVVTLMGFVYDDLYWGRMLWTICPLTALWLWSRGYMVRLAIIVWGGIWIITFITHWR